MEIGIDDLSAMYVMYICSTDTSDWKRVRYAVLMCMCRVRCSCLCPCFIVMY